MNQMIIVLMFALTCFSGISYSSETPPAAVDNNENQSNKAAVSRYDQGVDASHKNDYRKALPLFEEALKEDPDNPYILNMLAHAQRETGLIDEALINYKKAIALKPDFPEAHEYLGETYIQAALREEEILKNYGRDGKEQLEDLKKNMREALEDK